MIEGLLLALELLMILFLLIFITRLTPNVEERNLGFFSFHKNIHQQNSKSK